MNALNCIKKATDLGYTLNVKSNQLKLVYVSNKKLNVSAAQKIIKEIKANKIEVLKIENIKIKYTELLKRNEKAEVCLNSASDAQLEKWLPEFNKITRQLSGLQYYYFIITNIEMTENEKIHGFKQIDN